VGIGMRIISTSDWHLGHAWIDSEVTYTNFKKHLFPRLTVDVDILIISGDTFHKLLHLNNVAAQFSLILFQELLEICNKNNIVVRILEGTNSHDRDQPLTLGFLKSIHTDLDLKIINTLDLEYIKNLDSWVLYLPDDLQQEDPQGCAIKKIKEYGLTQVDLCVGHSYLKHLLPPGVHMPSGNIYDIDVLSRYVKGPMLFGHVHTTSVYKRAFMNGSFERHIHGEEEPKGFYCIDYDRDKNKIQYEFVENTTTWLFKTITLASEDLSIFEKIVTDLLLEVEQKQLPKPVHIRVKEPSDPLKIALVTYLTERPELPIRLTFLNKQRDSADDDIEQIELDLFSNLPKITEANINLLIAQWLDNKYTVNEITTLLSSINT
jgi:DNA repair exonuclease SbcCD nuclease subunit